MSDYPDPETYEKVVRWICAGAFAALAIFMMWETRQ